jgi:hypothetical protein
VERVVKTATEIVETARAALEAALVELSKLEEAAAKELDRAHEALDEATDRDHGGAAETVALEAATDAVDAIEELVSRIEDALHVVGPS